jgi:two-component system invasion response regulator UvrY
MNGSIIIASAAAAIVKIVEQSIRDVCPRAAIKRALDVVDLNRCINNLDPDYVFLESNFCQVATSYLMAQKLSDHPKMRFVVFSFEVLSPQDIGRFYNLGAVGFLNFRSGTEEYQEGVSELLRGNDYITKEAESALKDYRIGKLEQPAFTVREIQVLRYTARGKSLEEIAEILSITFRSVQNIKTRVYQKAGIKNNVQILLFALSMGYVTLQELVAEQEINNKEQRAKSKEQGGKGNGDED